MKETTSAHPIQNQIAVWWQEFWSEPGPLPRAIGCGLWGEMGDENARNELTLALINNHLFQNGTKLMIQISIFLNAVAPGQILDLKYLAK